jgi:hypothetical protein
MTGEERTMHGCKILLIESRLSGMPICFGAIRFAGVLSGSGDDRVTFTNDDFQIQ